MTTRIVVLISGSGSNLQALLDAVDLGGEVVRVVADKAEAGGLDRARAAGVDAVVVRPADHPDRAGWETALADAVAEAEPDLVVLAGFMRILSGAFVTRWTTVNVHPSLLPAFPGGRAVADALAWGAKVTGCTVHLVDEQVDHGPIIAQEAVPVLGDDDRDSLHARIQAVEHRLLPDAVRLLCAGRVVVTDRAVRILPDPDADPAPSHDQGPLR
jgi:phosphoribosylglycinamide formyltransferase-1